MAIIFIVTLSTTWISTQRIDLSLVISVVADFIGLALYFTLKYNQAKDQTIILNKIVENGTETREVVKKEASSVIASLERIDKSVRRHSLNYFCELSEVMEKDVTRSAEWFRKNGLKWIDIEKGFIDKRADIIGLMKNKIKEKPIILLNAKSGAGKTSIGFLLGYHLKEKENWKNVYYLDMKENQDVRKSDLIDFVTYLSEEKEPMEGSVSMNLVIIDNAHVASSVVRDIASTSKKWWDYARILIIVRTLEDSKMSLLLKPYVLEEDSQELMTTSDEKWSRIICGPMSPDMYLGIVKLGKVEFQKSVRNILQAVTEKEKLRAPEGIESLANILSAICGDSLRILSFILRLLEKNSYLVVKSEIQVQQLYQPDIICKLVNNYYNDLKFDISEKYGADSLRLDIENAYDKIFAIISLLNALEIPCNYDFILGLVEIAFPGFQISADAISKVVDYAEKSGDLVKHSYTTKEKTHHLYSLPHRAEASYLYRCRSNLKPTTEQDHRKIEMILIKLLEFCRDKSLPIPLLQVGVFSNNIELELHDLARYLNEVAPDIARLALEQEVDLTSGLLYNLGIWGHSLGLEIAKVIGKMKEPWEGLQTLWLMYNYQPPHQESNPVLDAINEIEDTIINSLSSSSMPWIIIREIEGIDPLITNPRVENAIKLTSNIIAQALRNNPEVLLYIQKVFYLLDNEAVVNAVAEAIIRLEVSRKSSEYYIGRYFKNEVYRNSKEIRKSIRKILPEILKRMKSIDYPSYIIGELHQIEDVLTNKDRKEIISCVDSLAEELQDPSSGIVLNKISWNIELLKNTKIIDAIVSKLNTDPNELLLVQVISAIPTLADNIKIRDAVLRAMKKSFYSDMFVEAVWTNKSWAEDDKFIEAAKAKAPAIAEAMLYHANPRHILLRLPKFMFEEDKLTEWINNPRVLSGIMTPVHPGLGVHFPFNKKVVEILESVLSVENKKLYAKQLAEGKTP